ncbi:caspase-8-like isoform X2 [Misgurnus anguillicaudatus]|uniref:caspase-8-like isoform X2 n=1 Tax=Misgurnus anguillicaudatus TaxID=75329 RepID=UPI003CCF4017
MDDKSMDLQMLLEIDEDLEKGEVAQLKFLCTDLVQKKRLETVTDFKDLSQRLEEQELLDDGLLIPELLITIRRLDLLKILNTSKEQVERYLAHDDCKRVSPYRKMLFQLSEDMTEENLRIVKFLSDLPKAKLETCTSFLDIIIEMEKQQKLGEENLDELKDILDKCDKQLADRIEKFRNMQRDREQVGGRPPLQEISNYEDFIPNYPDVRITSSMGTEMSEPRRASFGLATDSQIEKQTTTYDEKDYYPISHRPVGHCLIINNYDFEMSETSDGLKLRNRKGTDTDKESLERVFKKMHFEITVKDDLTASEMLELVKQFAEKDHSQMDIFVCCVLSHGEKGAVYGVDGKQVEIRELTQHPAKCQTLANKPKLFFIQACQGKVGQKAMWMADGPEQEEGTYEEDAQKVASYSIPIEADMLIGMATVEYYQSYRHTTEGSIYIQELCRQLEDLCPRNDDILSILTKVNSEVSTKTLRGFKQMPEPRYTLRKKLILPMD